MIVLVILKFKTKMFYFVFYFICLTKNATAGVFVLPVLIVIVSGVFWN